MSELKCERCKNSVNESDPSVRQIVSGQSMTSAFTYIYYHEVCLERDSIDKLEKENAELKKSLEVWREISHDIAILTQDKDVLFLLKLAEKETK